MKVKIIFTKGIPGCGKSHWSLEYCLKHSNTNRVNRDEIRTQRGKYWIPEQEDYITSIERHTVKEAMKRGYNVVVDAMNLNKKYMDAWLAFLKIVGEDEGVEYEVEYKDFTDVELHLCIERDAQRTKERRVGAKLIKELYYKYVADVKPVIYDPALPHAIICDIDGTICHGTGRNMYDYSKVLTDRPDEKVIAVIRDYLRDGHPSRSIIFMSGRDDIARHDSALWIKERMGLSPITLYMRVTGDERKDSIVKRELFERNIRGQFNIDFVLDDRNQVVDMWRNELGLKCLQVADGDF